MKNSLLIKNIATLGFIGYLPAPGTIASIIGLALLACGKRAGLTFIDGAIVIFLLTLISTYIVEQASYFFSSADPEPIVLDEVIGSFYIFIGISLTLKTAFIGFLLFRFFDIYKPLGLKRIERLTGSIGIMLDDIAAALLSCVCLNILNYFSLL